MPKSHNISTVKQFLETGFSHASDVECREMQAPQYRADLLYIKTLCDPKLINRYIVTPFWETESLETYQHFLISFPDCAKGEEIGEVMEKLLTGHVAIFAGDNLYLFDASLRQASAVSEATVELSVQGPQDAFNEDLLTSLNLVRRRYQADSLYVETHEVGRLSKTKVALVYDKNLVVETALQELNQEMARMKIDVLQSAGEFHNHLRHKKYQLFPLSMVTERPDRTVRYLAKGRVIVMVDTTPFVLILPATFSDFFSAMDDYSQLPVVGWFLKALRYTGFALTITLPGLYVGTISYNPEFFKVQLAFSIAASRAAVPYASYLEVIFMLLAMEFLTEASIRLPRAIGPTATTVGGLILGQAATEAGLISNIMIIMVSLVAIANYSIPLVEMNLAVRILKYIFVALASAFGLVGIVVGLVVLIFYLAGLTSFGTPYMQMIRKGGKE